MTDYEELEIKKELLEEYKTRVVNKVISILENSKSVTEAMQAVRSMLPGATR